MDGSNPVLTRIDYERAVVGTASFHIESEMALFSECTPQCAQKSLTEPTSSERRFIDD
jgi:hypothetical protein